jgi:hypothetical protein
MRAIAPSMPPHSCHRQSHWRPTPRFYAAGEVIDFALVAVYGLNNGSVGRVAGRARAMRAIAPSTPQHICSRQGRRRPTPIYFTAGEVIDFALVAVYGLNNSSVFPRKGPLEAHAEVLCRRRRRRNYGSNMRRRWPARREATVQAHRREG